MNWPVEFEAQMRDMLGAEAEALFDALQAPYFRGVRMNKRKKAALPDGTMDAVPWTENAYYLAIDSLAGASIEHTAGAFYLQEPSAMAAAAALNVQENDIVLDLCAAPGGKSTQMAARLKGGTLIANEINLARAQVLSSNIERLGIPNAVVTSAAPETLAARWKNVFDKILVDAPCSGEGMFRRHPEAMQEWTAQSPEGCAARQLGILEAAAQMLRFGGRMVYSTCTFNRLENDAQIARFLEAHPEFSLVPFALNGLPPAKNGTLHIWPHQVRGEGHFVALLKKEGTPEKRSSWHCPPPTKNERLLAEQFLSENVKEQHTVNGVFAGRIVEAPTFLPPLDKIKVLRLGLHLGTLKGKTFLPDHAMVVSDVFLKDVPLSKEQALSYLHGEALPASENLRGFITLSFEGLTLGFGKASDGQIKNHYPKGLRK